MSLALHRSRTALASAAGHASCAASPASGCRASTATWSRTPAPWMHCHRASTRRAGAARARALHLRGRVLASRSSGSVRMITSILQSFRSGAAAREPLRSRLAHTHTHTAGGSVEGRQTSVVGHSHHVNAVEVGWALGPARNSARRRMVRGCQPLARGVLEQDGQRNPTTQGRRPNRGHRLLGGRGWDDPVQWHVDAVCGVETPWHQVAHDRAQRAAMQAGFVARVLRRAPEEPLSRTRWMMQEAPELELEN